MCEILFRFGETDTVFAEVVDGVVFAEEGVSDDPDGTERGRNVETLEGGYACSLGVENVVCCWEGEVVAREAEGDVWKSGDFVAIDGVSTVPTLGSSDFLVQ